MIGSCALATLLLLLSIPVASLASGTAPKIADDPVHRENLPPLMSLYLPIPLDISGVPAQTTGVFVPAGYKAGKTVDLLVFLRGYDINRPKTATSVAEYWGSPQHSTLQSFLLREEVNKSGKNVILVVPTLGPRSEFGKLQDPGGVQQFLTSIVDGLMKNGPYAGLSERPTIRHLILAAHSGGGVPLRRLAQVLGDDPNFKDKLKECWGFDSIYGVRDRDAAFWSEWAKEHPGAKVSMFYIFTQKDVGKDPKMPVSKDNPFDHREPTNTSGPALELERLTKEQKLNNVAVFRETRETTLKHNDVPRAHLAELLKAAKYLDDRYMAMPDNNASSKTPVGWGKKAMNSQILAVRRLGKGKIVVAAGILGACLFVLIGVVVFSLGTKSRVDRIMGDIENDDLYQIQDGLWPLFRSLVPRGFYVNVQSRLRPEPFFHPVVHRSIDF